MTAPAAQHNAVNGAQPWVNPPNSGTLQLPAKAAQHQIAIATNTCNFNMKEWNTWIELSTKLKQQILNAADKAHLAELSNQLTGHAAVTVGELLNHLVTHHCQIKCGDIETVEKLLDQ
jgi:hypothetical protein